MKSIAIFSALAIACASAAEAKDFVCSEISQSGRAVTGELVPIKVAPESRLKIHIDTARPTRSSITWTNTGDAELDDQESRLTPGSRVIERDGEIFASMMADLKAMTSVGTLLISRSGELWITESTSANSKMAHYVIQGRCAAK